MTQKEKHNLDFLREIVERHTNTDIMSKSREREVIDARKIFANILDSFNFRNRVVTEYLQKNHATIIHYRRDFEYLYQADPDFRRLYDLCYEQFSGVGYQRKTNTELIFLIKDLEKQKNMLTLELKSVKDELNTELRNRKKYSSTLDLIYNKLRENKIEEFNDRINPILNGLI